MNLQESKVNKKVLLTTIIIMVCILGFAFLKGTRNDYIFALFIFMCMFILLFICLLRFAEKSRNCDSVVIKYIRYLVLSFLTSVLFTVMCGIIYAIIW